ncbi:MAG: PQQ-binding-like beta-propeller repeat protein, partial [bacterium]|nr:PQQ-binding-like beta-propeller repeat protein [bacterium]
MRAPRWVAAIAATAALSGAVAQPDATVAPDPASGAWLQHGRDPSATRFSPLAQIDRSNVADLRLVWAADLGFTGRVQGTPAAWSGTLYVSTTDGVMAFDAATGAPAWAYAEDSNERTSTGLPRQAPRGGPVVVPDLAGGPAVVVALPSSPT